MSLIDRVFAGEHLVLDARVREALPGKTAWLADGVTYYEIAGQPGGQPVILIHGFSVPNFIWDPTFAALAAAGFRVLRYDLFGRGYSDRPKARYDKALFVRQLAEDWLNAYPYDLAYQKDAFTFVTANLPIPKGMDMAYQTTKNGLTLRFVRGYDIMQDQFISRFDVLHGQKTLRREHACKIIGA